MVIETGALSSPSDEEEKGTKEKLAQKERKRLIAHLGRMFARRYDIAVIPSRQKGFWACALDPKLTQEFIRYIEGERETLDDLPPNAFVPTQIIYDEPSAQKMPLEEITTLLHHEAGHAKYTDFRLMVEGQRGAKDEGHLPTSFWLTFEGIEDPRVNSLEGEESPAIDRQIRKNQAKDLNDRLTEKSLSSRPKMLQFTWDTFHVWLHGEPVPADLNVDPDVAEAVEKALPLVKQYFANTDVEERRLLQQQIWQVAKGLEAADIEQEKKKQMAKQMGKGESGQGEGQGQSTSGAGGQGEEIAPPAIPGGTDESQPQVQGGGSGQQPSPNGQSETGREGQDKGRGKQKKEKSREKFLDRIKDAVFGPQSKEEKPSQEEKKTKGRDENDLDLSKFSQEDLRQIEEAIENLTPEELQELTEKARENLDEKQKKALEGRIPKSLKLRKNKKTGQYEVTPQIADEKTQREAEKNYQEILNEVEKEEEEEREREEEERRQQEEAFRQLEKERREKFEMEKAGFDTETEREKFLIYQELEDSMTAAVRNFRQAIEKVVPRRKEGRFEGGFFTGPKFDRRDLVRKAPLGDEQFWQRQVEKPIGEPRLFIGLLVDNSGSMNGKKMEEARKTMIFFAKVSHQMGIPFMTVSFGDRAEIVKTFRQDFENGADRIKPKLIDATGASGGSTNLHQGLGLIIEQMNEERRRLADCHGLIFVITDGQANTGLVGSDLRNYIEENRGRLTFKAFGLSGNENERTGIQNFLNFYFGESNCAYPAGFEDLPDEAFRVLRTNLIRFKKYIT